MKQQIVRFSPHQNAKVFAILMALTALTFILPFALIAIAVAPPGQGPAIWMALLMPIIYFVMSYLGVAVACLVYNFMFKHIGGIEFEASAASHNTPV